MSSSADLWACDTSVAFAALDETHQAYPECRRAIVERRPALAGHAAFETYSVLTRLPLHLRFTAEQAASLLASTFHDICWLDPARAEDLMNRLGRLGIIGGAVYDALVAEAAASNDRRLITRDRRAERTYRALGVAYELID